MELSDVQLFSPETLVDPYPAYRVLRDQSPIHHLPEMNLHVVTRYELVRDAIRRTEEFSNDIGDFLQQSRVISEMGLDEGTRGRVHEIESGMIPVPPTMVSADDPVHAMFRETVSQLFTGSQVRKAEADVREVIQRHIDALGTGGAIEFMEQFALPVPLEIIAQRMGIPESHRAFFNEAATAAAAQLKVEPLAPAEVLRRVELAAELQKLLVTLTEARKGADGSDMITVLANATLAGEDRPLSHGEMLSIYGQFLVAGHETTASAFGWGMLALARRPELQDAIRGDEKRIRTFVEEVLRIEAPVQGLPRLVTRDTELGGVELKQGQLIMLRFGAANRDERQFENPDEVDVEREKAGMQLAFGSGIHHCIGAPLARQELNIGFAELLDRFEGFALDAGAPAPSADPSFVLRGLPALHITARRRPA